MDVHPVDLADDDLMTALGELDRRRQLHGRDWEPPVLSAAAWVAGRRATDSGERFVLLAVRDGVAALGFAAVWLPLLDNLDKVYLEVVVDPGARGRGVGTALLDAVVDLARAEGRSLLVADVDLPLGGLEDHPYRRFAERHGFAVANVEVVREQELPVPDAQLDAWAARAAERSAGYEVSTHVDGFPEELAESLCVLLGQLAVDAPTGTLDFEEEVMTPERLAERLATTQAMDLALFETVAVTPDGVVAAQTTLAVARHEPHAFQWGTFVHREHRGHRLGLAVETANLRAVQQSHPHVTRARTQNAEDNDWMVAINEEMGFVPRELAVEVSRRL